MNFIQFSVLGREACSQHDCSRPALRVLGVLQAPRMCRTPARTFPLPLTGLCLDTPRVLPHTVIDSPRDVELLSENCNGPGPTGTRGSPHPHLPRTGNDWAWTSMYAFSRAAAGASVGFLQGPVLPQGRSCRLPPTLLCGACPPGAPDESRQCPTQLPLRRAAARLL